MGTKVKNEFVVPFTITELNLSTTVGIIWSTIPGNKTFAHGPAARDTPEVSEPSTSQGSFATVIRELFSFY